MPGIVLVGARSARQGTGPFLATGLVTGGATISGIVGTRADSVANALASLKQDPGIDCNGYTDLVEAISAEQPDAVVLCSPWQFHAEQLSVVATAGCHCLVEKPLAWPASYDEVDALLAAFEGRGLLLQMVAQWPWTLPSFIELHGGLPEEITQFAMRLSPISIGPAMITDSAPHFIAMLQALVGPGEFAEVAFELARDKALAMRCRYRHAAGSTAATLHLRTSPNRPRPAWYRINDLRVDRELVLPEYRQYFSAAGARVSLPDPIHCVAQSFLHNLARGSQTDGANLRQGHRNLQQLAAAWPQ